ncbi:MAG TPA: ABC transporter permease subunit [Acetobacteraceae bacterium]|nr:ABC transporter permease subunit [Acetobacteraceae bacterium]
MSDISLPAFASPKRLPNLFDIAAMVCFVALVVAVAGAARHTLAPLSAAEATAIHLDPAYLPGYALRTTLRMFAALFCSLVFTFTYATWAAKSRRAALLLIPVLDILQSVPILGFLSFTVVFFMNLFPGRVLGAECAAIFAIFTSQAWNMAFSLYQSLKTVPADLDEASRGFRLSAWQRFWRLEAPFATPGLVWNTMMSMSGGWFFVVASEAISVGNTTWKLPGIGSYVATALDARDMWAVAYAILAMLVVILLYDQLLFRPLVAWSAKFRFETTQGAQAEDPWMLRLLRRTRFLRWVGEGVGQGVDTFTGLRLQFLPAKPAARTQGAKPSRLVDAVFYALLGVVVLLALRRIVTFCAATLTLADVGEALLLGVYTMIRVAVLMVLAALVWVPVGVWLGLRPAWARRVQPVVQFLAAFPANLFFPIFVVAIVRFHINPEIGLTPLMILGTQWYILFNVIAGAAAFPGDLLESANNFRVGGLLWWRRVILPGIFPYFITGAITASGGSWNAAIVAEVASWGDLKLHAHGLGAYIAEATAQGDMPRVVLGVVVMSGFVVLFNRLLWRPLYAYSSRRLTL